MTFEKGLFLASTLIFWGWRKSQVSPIWTKNYFDIIYFFSNITLELSQKLISFHIFQYFWISYYLNRIQEIKTPLFCIFEERYSEFNKLHQNFLRTKTFYCSCIPKYLKSKKRLNFNMFYMKLYEIHHQFGNSSYFITYRKIIQVKSEYDEVSKHVLCVQE